MMDKRHNLPTQYTHKTMTTSTLPYAEPPTAGSPVPGQLVRNVGHAAPIWAVKSWMGTTVGMFEPGDVLVLVSYRTGYLGGVSNPSDASTTFMEVLLPAGHTGLIIVTPGLRVEQVHSTSETNT